MDVDLRVVAVKLTNRFRGVRPAREGKHVRVIKIHLGQSKGVVEEGEGEGRGQWEAQEGRKLQLNKRGGV